MFSVLIALMGCSEQALISAEGGRMLREIPDDAYELDGHDPDSVVGQDAGGSLDPDTSGDDPDEPGDDTTDGDDGDGSGSGGGDDSDDGDDGDDDDDADDDDADDGDDSDDSDDDDDVSGTGARMTGGGSVWLGDQRITHGFQLRCSTQSSDNLQINFDGNRFHATHLEWIDCLDDPALDPGNSPGTLDTIVGVVWGRYNGLQGASVEFRFTDDGEPGTTDVAEITLFDAFGELVMSTSGVLDRGNHQGHGDGAPMN